MKKYNNRKGITLIELVIALGLIGVISGLVFSFFFSNKKTLDRVEIKSDLQYEAKIIMDELSVYAMQAVNGKIANDSGNEVKISFDILEDGSVKSERIIFTFKEDNVILSEEGTSSIVELCKTEEVKVNVESAVTDKQGIKVKLILEKEDISYSVEDSFMFRNSHIQEP